MCGPPGNSPSLGLKEVSSFVRHPDRDPAVVEPVLVFSFLLLFYLKSAQIVSAGSPEAKPAEAHGSDSLLCAEVAL